MTIYQRKIHTQFYGYFEFFFTSPPSPDDVRNAVTKWLDGERPPIGMGDVTKKLIDAPDVEVEVFENHLMSIRKG